MTRKKLIAALDKALAPCREMDGKIATHYGWQKYEYLPSAYWLKPDGVQVSWTEVPAYTSSIDAAQTLLPPNAWWRVGDGSPYRGDADPAQSERASAFCRFNGGDEGWAFGATPAIALCIAALQAQEPTHGA
jgi:hypothetical protein